jgi:hypothetical protein
VKWTADDRSSCGKMWKGDVFPDSEIDQAYDVIEMRVLLIRNRGVWSFFISRVIFSQISRGLITLVGVRPNLGLSVVV